MDLSSPGGIPGLGSSSSHSSFARASFLGHSLPVHTLFSNKGGILDTIHEADGQTIKAFHVNSVIFSILKIFQGNVILRTADVTFPLISGASVDFFSRGAATISLLPSLEVSLQYKEVIADVTVKYAFLLSQKI